MKKPFIYIIIGALVIVLIITGLIWYLMNRREEVSTFSSDETISSDYIIEEGEKVVVRDGSILTIKGDLIVKGEIVCENGPLTLIIEGDTVIEGKLECDRGQELSEEDIGLGISIVVGNSFATGKDAEIVTNGHLQVVDNIDNLLTTEEEIKELYEAIENDTIEGNRFRPSVSEERASNVLSPSLAFQKKAKSTTSLVKNLGGASLLSLFKITPVYAQFLFAQPPTIRIRGTWRINTPPRNRRRPIYAFRFTNIAGLILEDFRMIGPDAHKGDDDIGECVVQGGPGQEAWWLFLYAPKIIIISATLELGDGGDGGLAETSVCKDAFATGGSGGKPGSFMINSYRESFDINGELIIIPGKSGNGGDAFAYGKDGGPGEDGGNATATGGNAGDTYQEYRTWGNVNGAENIKFESVFGGDGGYAFALGGVGGDGIICPGGNGGDGGDATAIGGRGGNATFLATGGMGLAPGAGVIGGDAGDIEANPGRGGDGISCCSDELGGDGGDGGDAVVTIAEGGFGDTEDGEDSKIINEAGGNGGNGGDGCPPGVRGKGGRGNPPGRDGLDGEDCCEELTFCGDGVIQSPNSDGLNEVCDGTSLGEATCVSQGYDLGTLSCSSDCQSFNTGNCENDLVITAYCGDGVIQSPNSDGVNEVCDGTSVGEETCTSRGFDYGTLSCSSNCVSFDISSCENEPVITAFCGDGVIQSPNSDGLNEVCDGTSLGEATCVSQGYDLGTLSCSSDCQSFDTSSCQTEPEPTFILTVEPQDLTFEHLIGFTSCPQSIGTVTITNEGTGTANSWKLTGDAPYWLSMSLSGSVPGSASIDFSCVLEEYVTQTLSTTLEFTLVDGESQPIGNPVNMTVIGNIIAD